jgi:hypothetical protein
MVFSCFAMGKGHGVEDIPKVRKGLWGGCRFVLGSKNHNTTTYSMNLSTNWQRACGSIRGQSTLCS